MISEEAYKDLDEFMEHGKKIAKTHEELFLDIAPMLYELYGKHYFPRGVNPDGTPIKGE